ncbi:MAG: 4-hydroxythreonine-4-phosphate dehydrogenase PdxA [Verrucomicrobiales bacterium]|nr:4-hydroxythreonine-4-phosphate dehydrogenase PdxA [Verrucomicrobiales bacterium]
MSAPLAITCGDHAGIGTEVTLKAIQAQSLGPASRRYVLIGDRGHVARWSERLGLDLPPAYDGPHQRASVSLLDPLNSPLAASLPPATPASALASLEFLQRAARGCLTGEFAGVVTAPVSKEAILRTGTPFVGQTEFLAEAAGRPEVTMMLLGDDAAGRWLRVALVTTHLPLREVADAITQPAVERAIRHALLACRSLRLPSSRIAVCGLNPHAGEGGLLGTEEQRVVRPAIETLRAQGISVTGPHAADTVFHEAAAGRHDVVVAMYHDQGLPPLKLLAFENGVNWTLGLPFPRTSPDHGTAFDIAGKGIAAATSMTAALRLADSLATGMEFSAVA